ncbi:MAG: 16S rRNA (cytosine(1402)-N(4))-methyltransferase, partial [SAR324 cluster bacterium]|nr:16S rRNA (cytosine(1402)-N(4))-methyltransferase [SAR324 cluster bacterium]
RIAVNREYEELERFLAAAPRLMRKNGRFACISFQSGEDKIVARTFREWASGDTAPAYLRTAHSREGIGTLVNKKPITASEEEILRNLSSRSARLRVFLFH